MDMTLAQRAVAFVAIVFLFVLACIGLAAYANARPELRLTTLIGEYSERTIGSRGFRIFDFDPSFRPAIRLC